MSDKKKLIGLMSGTSVDCIDAVLVAFESKKFEILHTHSIKISDSLREKINSLTISGGDEINRLCILDRELGLLFSQVANELLDSSELYTKKDILAIGSHGQTIRHKPPENIAGGHQGYSLQIGDPNMIAELTCITTIANFR
jgi:anhydro-N-acetylmuramic acid kinase